MSCFLIQEIETWMGVSSQITIVDTYFCRHKVASSKRMEKLLSSYEKGGNQNG